MANNNYLSLHFPAPPPLGWCGRLFVISSLLATAYLVGFALFIVFMPPPFTTLPPNLQGLVTFTGGSGRVEATLAQIQEGFKGQVLISGSHATTTLTEILAETSAHLTREERRRIMHDAAQTTRENITSLRVWAGYHHFTHIGVITSTYHTARVRLLLWMHIPRSEGLSVTILPVQPADAGLKPLLREYNKLLLAPFLR